MAPLPPANLTQSSFNVPFMCLMPTGLGCSSICSDVIS